MTNSAPVGLAERVDGEGHRVGAVAGLRAAQAHRDDVGAAGAPLHPLDDPGLRAGACVVEDLADREVGAGRDALLLAVGGGAGAGDGRGDVGAVAVDVGDRLAGHEAAGLGHLVGEVGVGLVDAGVEHGDGDAGAVEALRPTPRGRRPGRRCRRARPRPCRRAWILAMPPANRALVACAGRCSCPELGPRRPCSRRRRRRRCSAAPRLGCCGPARPRRRRGRRVRTGR